MKPAVIFDEPSHSYTSTKTNRKFISATTIVGKFKQEKDWRAIAENCVRNPRSKYYGGDVDTILQAWDDNKNAACVRGTAFHQKKENEVLAAQGQSIIYPIPPHYVHARPFPDYSNLPDGILPEMLVWDEYWEIAGQVDKPVFEGDFFDVLDFKTSKVIELKSFHNKPYYNKVLRKQIPGGFEMMKFPLNHLMDCNKVHYELQLSLYAYMIERLTGKIARNLTILHHPSDYDTNTVQEESIEYPCTYRKNDIELMLQHYFKKGLPDD